MISDFGVSETHGILLRPDTEIYASSDGLGWQNIYASVQHTHPYEASYDGVTNDLIIMHFNGPVTVHCAGGGRKAQRTIPPRGLCMMPAKMDFTGRVEQEVDCFHLYIRHRLIVDVASELMEGHADQVELVPKEGEEDSLVEHLMLEVRSLVENKELRDTIYIDYLSLALAGRLVRRHSTISRSPSQSKTAPGGLSRTQMARVTEFVDANLDRSISLAQIASAVGLTVTHFARRFKVSMDLPPHQYLIRRRFERAKWLVGQTNMGLAEIAFSSGFSHQEHLTRVFRQLGNTTPGAYRRHLRS